LPDQLEETCKEQNIFMFFTRERERQTDEREREREREREKKLEDNAIVK